MTPDDLLLKIESLIKAKNTYPLLLTFAQMKQGIDGDQKELRESFFELVRQGKIRVREGKNTKLVEVCQK